MTTVEDMCGHVTEAGLIIGHHWPGHPERLTAWRQYDNYYIVLLKHKSFNVYSWISFDLEFGLRSYIHPTWDLYQGDIPFLSEELID